MTNLGKGELKDDINLDLKNGLVFAKFDLGYNEKDSKFLYQNHHAEINLGKPENNMYWVKCEAFGEHAKQLEGLKAGQIIDVTGMCDDRTSDRTTFYINEANFEKKTDEKFNITNKSTMIGEVWKDIKMQNDEGYKTTQFSIGNKGENGEYNWQKCTAINQQAEKLNGVKAGQLIEIHGAFGKVNSGIETNSHILFVAESRQLTINESLTHSVIEKNFTEIKKSVKNGADIKIITPDHLKNYSPEEKTNFKTAAMEGLAESCKMNKDVLNNLSQSNDLNKGIKI